MPGFGGRNRLESFGYEIHPDVPDLDGSLWTGCGRAVRGGGPRCERTVNYPTCALRVGLWKVQRLDESFSL